MITILVEVSFCHKKLQSLLLPWTSTMTPARGYRNIAEPSKAWENTAPPTLLLTCLSPNFPHRPGSVPLGVWGSWDCPASPIFPSTCSLCPIHCVLFRYSHSLSTSSSSDSVIASNLEPLTFSKEAPSPCTLPLGSCCPWGLPCHLSELSLFCTHRRLRLIEGKSFGLFCTSWVNS